MKRPLITIAALSLLAISAAPLPAQQEEQTVALIGPDYAVKVFQKYVTEPLSVPSDAFVEAAPSVGEYAQYKSVVFLEHFPKEGSGDSAYWNVDDNLDAVRKYVREGGKVFIFGAAFPRKSEGARDFRNLQFCDDLLGFSAHPNTDLTNPVNVSDAGEAFFVSEQDMDFVVAYTGTVSRITSAEILATALDSKGETHPFATRNAFGKGEVFYFGTSPFRLRRAEREATDESDSLVTAYSEILQKFFK